jgi:toxin ParE1/3/4
MTTYVLSPRARADIKKIMQYTVREWGASQTKLYSQGLHALFIKLAKNKNLGRTRTDLEADGIKSFLYEKHVIYYKPHSKGILIVRVLHHAQDLQNHSV